MISKSTMQRRHAIVYAYGAAPALAQAYVKINNWTYISVARSLFGNGFCVCLMCDDYIGGGDEFFILKRDAMSYARDASRILNLPIVCNGKPA